MIFTLDWNDAVLICPLKRFQIKFKNNLFIFQIQLNFIVLGVNLCLNLLFLFRDRNLLPPKNHKLIVFKGKEISKNNIELFHIVG